MVCFGQNAKYISQQKLALRMTSKAPMLSMTYLFKLRDFGHLSISKLTVVVSNKTFIKQNFIAFHKELRSDKFKCNFRKLIRWVHFKIILNRLNILKHQEMFQSINLCLFHIATDEYFGVATQKRWSTRAKCVLFSNSGIIPCVHVSFIYLFVLFVEVKMK